MSARSAQAAITKKGTSRAGVIVQPWQARGIKMHGKAEIVESNGPASLTLVPYRLWSWGVDGAAFKDAKPVSRKARRE